MARTSFDEMHGVPSGVPTGAPAAVRSAYASLQVWLNETPHATFDTRRSQAELFFRRVGITFAVYGDNEASERLIPFDVIPRVLVKSEWEFLERGLKQRVGGDQRLPGRHLRAAGLHPGRDRAGRSDLPQSAIPAGDEGRAGPARRLRPHRGHRRGPGRRGGILRPGGQCTHALRRLLHAGEPGGDDAALPRTFRQSPDRARRELSGRAPRDAAIGRAAGRGRPRTRS